MGEDAVHSVYSQTHFEGPRGIQLDPGSLGQLRPRTLNSSSLSFFLILLTQTHQARHPVPSSAVSGLTLAPAGYVHQANWQISQIRDWFSGPDGWCTFDWWTSPLGHTMSNGELQLESE